MMTLASIWRALAPDRPAPEPVARASICVCGACVDSRQAAPGELFVALRGERSDGHQYVQAAYQAGAGVALIDQPIAGLPTIDLVEGTLPVSVQAPIAVRVPDALVGLQQLATYQRQSQPQTCVVAVTGSVGKTTTKEAVAAVLSTRSSTLKSTGNHNNEIGLPLTLMQLSSEHEHAVLEMGMYDLGEIALLCDIAGPNVGLVTNVQPVHLERLGTIERIAQAKAELVQALPPDGLAVLNGDDPRVRAMGSLTAAPAITYGMNADCTVWADSMESLGLDGLRFTLHIVGNERFCVDGERTFRSPALGRHAIWSLLGAAAVGLAGGLGWDAIEEGFQAQELNLRMVPRRGRNETMVLDDCYNASPSSSMAAVDFLVELPGRHIAVLGDMLELGAEEAAGHRATGAHCAGQVDLLVTVGERARLIADGARHAGLAEDAIIECDSNSQAIASIARRLEPADVILIKGSRSMAMEEIVSALVTPEPDSSATRGEQG